MKYKLRKVNIKDIDSITKYVNNENIAKWLTNEFPHPYSKKDAETFIHIVSNENPVKTFTIEIDGEACGSIAVNPIKNPIKQFDETVQETNEKIDTNSNEKNQDTIIDIMINKAN